MRKCILVFISGSFRLGGQGNMSLGDPRSYEEQKQACMSHVAFCKHLESVHNVSPEIHLNTYETRYSSEMLQWYSEYPVTHVFHKTLLGYTGIMDDAVARLQLEEDDHEFVLFIRADLLLKPDFFNVNVFERRLCFSSICFTLKNWHLHNGFPRVADLILLVPRNLFNLIRDRKISLNHDSYEHYLAHGLKNTDIGFLVDTFHDSDSQKDWNPIYKIVNRPETTRWHDRGRKISDVFKDGGTVVTVHDETYLWEKSGRSLFG
jgi:hypothetical protein